MELIFLNEQTLSVIDYAFATDDYEIVLDSLMPQKSFFNINKEKLNAEIGDLLTVRENNYFYIGIISEIQDDVEGKIKVTSLDYLSILDIEVPVPTSFRGNVATFLLTRIKESYVNSDDNFQNIPYLLLENEVGVTSEITYDEDTKINLLDLLKEFSKKYNIRIEYEWVFEDGNFSKIKLTTKQTDLGLVIRSDIPTVRDLVINDTKEGDINKIIFLPKAANTKRFDTISYVLLTSGSVVKLNDFIIRLDKKVRFKYEYYSDDDYANLLAKAKELLIDSSFEHNITFNFSIKENKIETLNNIKLGVFVRFISPNKTYDSIISKLSFKGTLDVVKVILGEFRTSLTDKLKLLDRRT